MSILREWVFLYRHKRACKRLQRITQERAQSYPIQRYRQQREAALKGWQRRRGG